MSSWASMFVSGLMSIDEAQTDLFFGLVILVDFHLVFSVFGFRLILLREKDA